MHRLVVGLGGSSLSILGDISPTQFVTVISYNRVFLSGPFSPL